VDVRSLLEASFARLAGELCLAPPLLSEAAHARLVRYDWPGNVRELQNASERLMIRNSGGLVDDTHLNGILDDVRFEGRPSLDPEGFRSEDVMAAANPVALIASELQAAGGNVARTARRLGLPRSTLRHWIRRHDIR
jgi:DNA-binding NtrC family response regulator